MIKKTPLYFSSWKIYGILFISAFILYGVVLPTPFKSLDDFVCIINNPYIRSISYIPNIFTESFFGEGAYYRPLVTLSFLIEYRLFQLKPFFYNLNNLLLHIANAIAVFWLVVMLMNNRKTAFFAAWLFVLHPIHWEAVGNIPGRSILLCAFFMLYAFLAYIQALRQRRWGLYLLSLILFTGSLLTKESGVVLLGVLGVYMYLFENPEQKWIQKGYVRIFPFVGITAVYLWIRGALDIYSYLHWGTYRELILGMGSFLWAAFHYLHILVIPIDFYFDHSSPLILYFTDIRFWAALLFWMILALVLWRKRAALGRVYVFFILWIVMNIAPTSQIVPIRVPKHHISTPDHFLYVPSIGFFVIFVSVLYMLVKRFIRKKMVSAGVVRLIAVLYMLYLVVVCFTQNIFATNMFAMYKKTLKHNANNHRVRNSMGVSYAMVGRFAEAQKHFHHILAVDPHFEKARLALAETYNDQGLYWLALTEYEKVKHPDDAGDFKKQGVIRAITALLREYRHALDEDPENMEALYSLGVVYAKAGKYDQAEVSFQEVLKRKPAFEPALFNLGTVLGLQGRHQQAIGYFEKVIINDSPAEDNHDTLAYAYLSRIYSDLGEQDKADQFFEKYQKMSIIERSE